MTMNSTAQWADAIQAVQAANRIVVVTHLNPDGDAIGSLLGLTNALREMGKDVTAAVDGGVPNYLRFLTGVETVLPLLETGDWDLLVSVDASDEERTGLSGIYARAHSAKIINLDHHPTNTLFGDIFLVVPTAVSATEIILNWLESFPHPISVPVAVALLTGLVTDTRGFRTSNVLPATLGCAQRLLEAGASLTMITARTLDSMTYATVELWKHVLPSVVLDGPVISATVLCEDIRRANMTERDSGGLVSWLLSTDQAMVAVVFKELENGNVELSMRSKPGFDVGSVAFGLGGGGHKQASGATIPGPIEAARDRVVPLLQQAAREGKLQLS